MTTPAPPATRPKPDRFLLAILAGVGLLLVAAAISIFILRQPPPQLPADSPGGTIQRFYTAIEQGDYDKAYDFLSNQTPGRPTRYAFVLYWTNQRVYRPHELVRIDDEKVIGTRVIVSVGITQFYDSGPFFGGRQEYTNREFFRLQREDSTWRITGLPIGYGPTQNP